MQRFQIFPAGDQALVAEFDNIISEEVNQQVHELAQALMAAHIPGLRELLPAFRSLMVCYDPDRISFDELSQKLEQLSCRQKSSVTLRQKVWQIPCCYEEPFGPDLEDMSRITGLSAREIIRIHSGTDYKIYMLGFLPGFVYLGGLDRRLECPRLDNPRTQIPAGAVGIGGSQTGIYPLPSPGGWRLIGQTPVKLYDPEREEPILCQAGEQIRFVPISYGEYLRIEADVTAGVYPYRYQYG